MCEGSVRAVEYFSKQVGISENAERANPYDLNPYDPRCIPKFVKSLIILTILTKYILECDNSVISILDNKIFNMIYFNIYSMNILRNEYTSST